MEFQIAMGDLFMGDVYSPLENNMAVMRGDDFDLIGREKAIC